MLDLLAELRDTAIDLHRAGAAIALCPPGSKAPIGEGWQNRRWSARDIRATYRAHDGACNVGLRMGQPAKRRALCNLIDIECDGPRAEHDFTALFADTDPPVTVCWRSRRGRHRLYRASDRLLGAIDRASVKLGALDILIGGGRKGAQALIPPSRADGVDREWLVDFDHCDPAPLPAIVEKRLIERFGKPRHHDQIDSVGCAQQESGSVSSGAQTGPPAPAPYAPPPARTPPNTSSVRTPVLCPTGVAEGVLCRAEVARAIAATLPWGPCQRHDRIFELARRLKAIHAQASLDDLKPILHEWHERAKPFIKTKPFTATWRDFADAWSKVRVPYGAALSASFATAMAQPIPLAATRYSDPKLQALVALCAQLQREAGAEPFYATNRAVGRLFGVDFRIASQWQQTLVRDGLLKLVERGRPGRAARYRFLGDLDTAADTDAA